MRAISPLIICAAALAADRPGTAAGEPAIPPRTFTYAPPGGKAPLGDVLRDLTRQTNIAVDPGSADPGGEITSNFRAVPFWEALQRIAAETGHRVVLRDRGKAIALEKSDAPAPPASVSGPFRIAARELAARRDLDTGRSTYHLALSVNWEPRFKVFRIDAYPTVTSGRDDRGGVVTAPAVKAKTPVTGFQADSRVRLEGLSADSRAVAELSGAFTATVAEKMLLFRFDDLTAAQPLTQKQEGVTATLRRFEKRGDRWVAEVELRYPPGQPEFESFESWLGENRLTLVAPGGRRRFPSEDYEVLAGGEVARVRYLFEEDPDRGLTPGDRKGWSLEYETPSPLKEVTVPFTLRDIPLP
ncbi:MAG TPA: hypothetical protein VIL46_02690 [Gemmataceae bacterium]